MSLQNSNVTPERGEEFSKRCGEGTANEEGRNPGERSDMEESASRRKEGSVAVTGTEMPEVVSGFGNRKFIDHLDEGIQP